MVNEIRQISHSWLYTHKGVNINHWEINFISLRLGQKVLVIGAGPSGVDIVNLLSKTCKHVTFSQKMGKYGSEDAIKQRQSVLPSNCVLKDVVKRFTMTGAEFVDGTHETFTTIIWATGYDFAYPFLSVDCDIHVDDRFVQPLYKQVLNINHPTMAFIGIPSSCCTTQLFDLQVCHNV